MGTHRDEVVLQQHMYVLERIVGFGFGIAVSGGVDNPGSRDGDTAIVISDVIKGGPAFDKIIVGDVVLAVNGNAMDGLSHSDAVTMLKAAGRRAEITVKRKAIVKVPIQAPKPVPRSKSREYLDNDSEAQTYSSRSRTNRTRDYYSEYSDDSRNGNSRSKTRHRSQSRGQSRGRSYSRRDSRSRSESSDSYSEDDSRNYKRRTGGRKSHGTGYESRGRGRTKSYDADTYRQDERDRSRGAALDKSRRHSGRSQPNLPSICSPLSPDKQLNPNAGDPDDPENIQLLPGDMMRVPVKQHDPQNVILQKSRQKKESYGLRLGTKLYIEDIQAGSLAERSGSLTTGDLIIMINQRSTDNLTVAEAIQLITKTKDRLTITVQRANGGTVTIPTSMSRPASRVASRAASRNASRAASPESDDRAPIGQYNPSGGVAKELIPGTRHFYQEPEPRSKGPSRAHSSKNLAETSYPQNQPSIDMHAVAAALPQNGALSRAGTRQLTNECREIMFHKGKTVGIRLVGGNDTGLFVASVQEGSPASQQGLQIGDQLVQVNGEDFKGKTREEAVTCLMGLPIGQKVSIIVRASDPSSYEPILMKSSGDCFYVKANFCYEPASSEMEVTRGAVYCVRDTLYKGQFGKWYACELDQEHREVNYGIIPSVGRAGKIKEAQDRKESQRREKHGARKIKEKLLKGNSGPSRVTSAPSSSLIDLPAYERVVLREASFRRPVVIFGAIADIARNMLCSDHPQSYESAGVSQANQPQKSGRRGIVKISTINSIIECDRHAVVDITPSASEKLNKARLYPIVIFLKINDKALVKDMRARYTNAHDASKDGKQRSSKKMHQRALKLEKGYNHVFSSVVDVSQDPGTWYRRLQQEIKRLQTSLVWVNEDIHPEAADDRIIDDDRISMISAPDSQYSCTTIGSNMANSRLNLDDFSDEDDGSQATASSNSNPVARQPMQSNMPQHSAYKPEESNEDPPPPTGPAPIPPRKDYGHGSPSAGLSSAGKALANVIQGKPPDANNSSFLQSHIQNMNRTTAYSPQQQTPTASPGYGYGQPRQADYQAPLPVEPKRHQQQQGYAQEHGYRQPHQNTPPKPSNAPTFKEPGSTLQQFSYSPRQVSFDQKPKPVPPTKPQVAPKPKSQYAEYVAQLRSQPIPNKYGAGNNMPRSNGSAASGASIGSSGGGSKGSNFSAGRNTGVPVNPQQIEEVEDGHEVIATARGTFNSTGGLLTNVETGVSIFVPAGAIPPNTEQEIYFKVCRETSNDPHNTEQLLSPMVMCGPHGLNFNTPVELRLPHNANVTEQGWQYGTKQPGSESNQVSVMIDHF